MLFRSMLRVCDLLPFGLTARLFPSGDVFGVRGEDVDFHAAVLLPGGIIHVGGDRLELGVFRRSHAVLLESDLAELTIDRDRDKNPVVALREIAEETIRPNELHEAVVSSLQRVQIDDEEEADAVGSLAASAEALRLTAVAPPRNQNLGGDYDG